MKKINFEQMENISGGISNDCHRNIILSGMMFGLFGLGILGLALGAAGCIYPGVGRSHGASGSW